jgi:hypothetical protein
MPMQPSFNQEAALAVERANPLSTPPHQLTVTLRIVTPIDVAGLERAFMTLIARHAILRTSFVVTATPPVAIVHPHAEWHLAERRLNGEDDVPDAIARIAAQRLDSGTAPLMRATVLHAGSTAQYLSISISHLLVDATAMRQFVRELALAYQCEMEHRPAVWPDEGRPYHEFAAWQRDQYQSGAFARDEVFWLRRWLGLNGAVIGYRDLPCARPVSRGDTGPVMKRLEIRLPRTDAARIRTALKGLEMTPYTLFRAAVTLVLHRWTNKQRLALWANFANRRRLSFKRVIGWCANTHIVVTDADTPATCREFCAHVARAVYEAQTHEALPLQALWSKLGRTLNVNETRVNFDRAWSRPLAASDVLFEHTGLAAALPLMDLDARVRDEPDGYSVLATFNESRYETAGVEQLIASTCRVATTFAADPDASLSSCDRLIAM